MKKSKHNVLEFVFKITTQECVTVPVEYQDEVLEQVMAGKIDTANGIYNYIYEKYGDCNVQCNEVENAQEQMSVLENGGCPTIEVLDNGEDVWDNGNENLERDFHEIKDILNSYRSIACTIGKPPKGNGWRQGRQPNLVDDFAYRFAVTVEDRFAELVAQDRAPKRDRLLAIGGDLEVCVWLASALLPLVIAEDQRPSLAEHFSPIAKPP